MGLQELGSTRLPEAIGTGVWAVRLHTLLEGVVIFSEALAVVNRLVDGGPIGSHTAEHEVEGAVRVGTLPVDSPWEDGWPRKVVLSDV